MLPAVEEEEEGIHTAASSSQVEAGSGPWESRLLQILVQPNDLKQEGDATLPISLSGRKADHGKPHPVQPAGGECGRHTETRLE